MKSFSWVNSKLEVKETTSMGKGVFAKRKIPKGELLIVMGGYVFSIYDENHLSEFSSDKPIEISEHFSLCPNDEGDMDMMKQHYLNHSCDPNVGFRGQLFMVAMRDIEESEELRYDYAMIMHPNDKSTATFKMTCLCGTSNCRGLITERDWELEDLQKKYDGYFQYYLQEKIKNPQEKLYELPDDFYVDPK